MTTEMFGGGGHRATSSPPPSLLPAATLGGGGPATVLVRLTRGGAMLEVLRQDLIFRTGRAPRG